MKKIIKAGMFFMKIIFLSAISCNKVEKSKTNLNNNNRNTIVIYDDNSLCNDSCDMTFLNLKLEHMAMINAEIKNFSKDVIIIKILKNDGKIFIKLNGVYSSTSLIDEKFAVHFIKDYGDKVVLGVFEDYEEFLIEKAKVKMRIMERFFPDEFKLFVTYGNEVEIIPPTVGYPEQKELVFEGYN